MGQTMCRIVDLQRAPSWEGAQQRQKRNTTTETRAPATSHPVLKKYSPLHSTPAIASHGLLPPVKPVGVKVQIPKSLFNLVKSIFDEHDMDGDRQIDENEFIEAVGRADEKSAEQEAARIKERYFDQQVGGTIAAMAEKRRLLGSEARRRHARGMFHSVTSKKSTHEQHITLLDWVSMFFPHLPRSAVKKACDKYAPEQPPTVVKKKTLNDINGAKEEIGDMFLGLDADRDGLV